MRALVVAVLLAVPLAAHDGVHEQLERATKKIAAEPGNAVRGSFVGTADEILG